MPLCKGKIALSDFAISLKRRKMRWRLRNIWVLTCLWVCGCLLSRILIAFRKDEESTEDCWRWDLCVKYREDNKVLLTGAEGKRIRVSYFQSSDMTWLFICFFWLTELSRTSFDYLPKWEIFISCWIWAIVIFISETLKRQLEKIGNFWYLFDGSYY